MKQGGLAAGSILETSEMGLEPQRLGGSGEVRQHELEKAVKLSGIGDILPGAWHGQSSEHDGEGAGGIAFPAMFRKMDFIPRPSRQAPACLGAGHDMPETDTTSACST